MSEQDADDSFSLFHVDCHITFVTYIHPSLFTFITPKNVVISVNGSVIPLRFRSILFTAVLFILLSSAVLCVISDDGDGASVCKATVMFGDGTESGTYTYSGSGSSVKTLITETMKNNGHEIELNNNGKVKSVDGKLKNDYQQWVVHQWRPPAGWTVVYLNSSADAYLSNGTTYYISYATSSIKDNKTVYSEPVVKPTGTAYFFIKFVEDYNANSYVVSVLTEEQRKAGFWISGTGSNMAEAFRDACDKYNLELNMSDGVKDGVTNIDYIGWLYSFFGLTDEGDTSAGYTGIDWKYWSQFYWDSKTNSWVYSETMGHYDPSVTHYFALVRQITKEGDKAWGHGQTPPAAPTEQIKNGCKVTFVDGDGNTVATKTADYFKGVTAPSTATKTASGGKTYKFAGWEGNYSQVICDTVIKAVFTESSSGSSGKAVTGVTVSSPLKTVGTGEIVQLTATVSPSDADNKSVIWSVSDSDIAYIDSEGRLVAKKEGNVTVTATTVDGGKTGSVTLTVTSSAIPVQSVKISGSISSAEIDSSVRLTAEITPSNATDKKLTWKVSDSDIATISSGGTLTGKSAGTVTVTVSSADGKQTDSVTITITAPSPKSVSIENGNRTIKVGENHSLSVTVLPANAGNKSVVWTSGDSSIATVDDKGNVTAVKAGTVKITATTVDGNLKANCIIAVYSDEDTSSISENKVEISDNTASVYVDAGAKNKLAESGKGYTLTVVDNGSITLSSEVLKNISGGGFTLTFTNIDSNSLTEVQKEIVGDRQVFDFTIDSENKDNLGGKATVTLKYTLKDGENAEGIRIYHIKEDGSLEELNCSYDTKNSTVTFETDHFSMYFVASEDLIGSDNNGGDSNTTIIIAVAVATVIVIAGVAFFLFRRR